MLSETTTYVYGTLPPRDRAPGRRQAVVAFARTPDGHTLVDICADVGAGSYYGLNLPAGDYLFALGADFDGDGHLSKSEILSTREVQVASSVREESRVLAGVDMPESGVGPAKALPANIDVVLPVAPAPCAESLFYPRGTLRSLDDPLFSPANARLGLYAPARFIEKAPLMFYALEEDRGEKIPVIFVHGIAGSARDFAPLVAALDRSRYKPWFFHYPSGGDLGQLARLFHEIFLSGRVIPMRENRAVIIAHSMGGVLVREALNHASSNEEAVKEIEVITLASPLGGHPAARLSSHAPYPIPSWKCLNPDGKFIHGLYRKPLAQGVRYHLYYAHEDPGPSLPPEASDGVVPLSSQLAPAARREAIEERGFRTSHTGMLTEPAVVHRVLDVLRGVPQPLPEDHMRYVREGGYDFPLGRDYSSRDVFVVRNYGRYLDAVAGGLLLPIYPIQENLVEVNAGRRKPVNALDRLLLKLNRDYPGRSRPTASKAMRTDGEASAGVAQCSSHCR